MLEATEHQLEQWLSEAKVSELRILADRVNNFYQGSPEDSLKLIHRLGSHRTGEARMLAGYCMSWCATLRWSEVCSLATTLADDSYWPVREAVTFGIRDALVDAFDTIFPDIAPWASSSKVNLRRGYVVMTRQPAKQRTQNMSLMLDTLEKVLPDKTEYVRKNMPFALKYICANHPDLLLQYLQRWSDMSNEQVLWAVAMALTGRIARTHPRESLLILGKITSDSRPYVYQAVVKAIYEIAKTSPGEVAAFLEEWEVDPKRRQIASQVRGKLK